MTIGSVSTRITTRFVALLAALMLVLCAGMLAGCQDNASTGASDSASAAASSDAATIEVSMTIDATEAKGEKTTDTIEVAEGATVLDVLEASDHEIDVQDSSYGKFVNAIDGVATGDVTDSSGWLVAVNGEDIMVSADEQEVKAGDEIAWRFVTSFE